MFGIGDVAAHDPDRVFARIARTGAEDVVERLAMEHLVVDLALAEVDRRFLVGGQRIVDDDAAWLFREPAVIRPVDSMRLPRT